MLLKDGVSVDGCRAEILIAAISIICPLFKRYGHQAVVTSGTEKFKHSAHRSRHYKGDALYFRSKYFDKKFHQPESSEQTAGHQRPKRQRGLYQKRNICLGICF